MLSLDPEAFRIHLNERSLFFSAMEMDKYSSTKLLRVLLCYDLLVLDNLGGIICTCTYFIIKSCLIEYIYHYKY